MGRIQPTVCYHGVVLDWGDYGPCVDGCDREHPGSDDCPNFQDCPACAADEHTHMWSDEIMGDGHSETACAERPTEPVQNGSNREGA